MPARKLLLAVSILVLSAAQASPADDNWLIVSGEKCNLRKEPQSDSSKLTVLGKFTPLKKLGPIDNDYYKVRTPSGKTGWAHKTTVRAGCFISIGTFKKGVLEAPAVNFRTNAGQDFDIAFCVTPKPYYPVRALDRDGSYVKVVDWQGDDAWVHESLLTLKRCCVVNIDSANIRAGAGLNYEIVCEAEKGVFLEIIGAEGKWLEVRHADGKNAGWISSNIVWGENDNEEEE
jgi:SH3-like domain-containing protein